MDARFRRVLTRPLAIRTLIALWAGSVLLAWILLVGGWLIAKTELSRIADRAMTDMRALAEARELESAILAHRREDLLWETTRQSGHQERAREHLRRAEQIAASMDPYVTTQRERELLVQIQQRLRPFREEWTPTTTISAAAEAQSVDDLLTRVDQFRAQNESQMAESIRVENRLHAMVSYWALGLSITTAGLLLAGALGLVRRVIRPVLALTDAASAFGQGDFSAKAPILHDDEMGALARIFNNMADDIADRERNRLQFVAMVVHDLKNPVLAIEMTARMLRGSAANAEQQRFCLEGIKEEVARLRRIIRDLTDDIQVANGRFSVHKAEVDLSALVGQFIKTHGQAFTTHEIAVETAEDCLIQGDADRIERVLMNLVSNAVKYSPRGTRVTVHVEKKDALAVLTVSDQGPGIAKDDLHVLFQPFGRGRSAHTLAEGTGIGLFVVKQIVEAHGGRIDVQSELGRGTTFQIELPLVQSLEAARK